MTIMSITVGFVSDVAVTVSAPEGNYCRDCKYGYHSGSHVCYGKVVTYEGGRGGYCG